MLNASTGYYIARQDADDISYLERIEKQIEALEKNNFDVIYTRAIKRIQSFNSRFLILSTTQNFI